MFTYLKQAVNKMNDTNNPTDLLTVLTLNLRFGLADDGPNSWQHRKTIIASLLKKYPTDFIGFQEANDFQIDYLNETLSGYDYIGKRTPAPHFWQNNVIFYKRTWKCTYYEHFFLSPTPRIPSRNRESIWPRQCTIGMFKNNDRMLICVNTHFDFDASVQIEGAGLIIKQLSHLPPDLSAVLIGDFNATPDSPCHMIFTGQDQESGPGKSRPFQNAFSEPFPGTIHKFTGNTKGEHIDWILYRGGIMKKNCKVIPDTINGIYPSDHFPLFASFIWEA